MASPCPGPEAGIPFFALRDPTRPSYGYFSDLSGLIPTSLPLLLGCSASSILFLGVSLGNTSHFFQRSAHFALYLSPHPGHVWLLFPSFLPLCHALLSITAGIIKRHNFFYCICSPTVSKTFEGLKHELENDSVQCLAPNLANKRPSDR